jgi:hypothetical protein
MTEIAIILLSGSVILLCGATICNALGGRQLSKRIRALEGK